MSTSLIRRQGRGLERLFLILIASVFGFLFYALYSVLQRDFAEVNKRLQAGTMINLNDKDPGSHIQTLLQKGYYFEDPKDIQLITSVVAAQLQPGVDMIDNIGELNKSKYDVEAAHAFLRGGQSFKKRVLISQALLGYTGEDSLRFLQEQKSPVSYPSSTNVGMGKYTIEGNITRQEDAPVGGVLVRLRMVLPQDSASGDYVAEDVKQVLEKGNGFQRLYIIDSTSGRQLQSLSAYSRTDANGHYAFTNLPGDKSFEVIPLQPGYQFGIAQGVQQLDENTSFSFSQQPHRLRLLSGRDFNILKKEKSLIIRTPEEFTQWYLVIIAGFFLGFVIIHLLLSIKFQQADQLIVPILMVFTGLSLVTLLSLQDPLRDRFLAKTTLYYFGIGVLGICLFSFINLRRFTTDSSLYRLFIFKHARKAANGWPWAILAVGLLALTIMFGTGPEGSGVKVNLFGVQPSEVVKFFIIIFLAGFFSVNEKFIAEYTTWRKRSSFFSFAVIAIVVAILLFLMLGDLGPAMIVCFTFIILFSFSRGDFLFMVGAVVLYVLAVWIVDDVLIATLITAVSLVLAVLFKRRQLSESAVMALVVMAGFLLLDQIPYLQKVIPGPMTRLVERKAIWQDAWNNEVYGGDHVANGIWAMASGGIQGQGVGEGFAKTIPEAHTDMILPSLGEEFGWAGIICIFILFLIYLHRAILIGRQTGTPFLFYLCAGIGISTFIQFLLIAGGSTGALPLSGVSLPFISYGGSSLVANMLAAGFLLSASRVQGTVVQMSFIARQQDKNLVPALLAAFTGIILLGVNVSRYLFNNDKWVVQPALVADKSGARMFSYNPRINILMNKLEAGSLYDRAGRILATSQPALIRKQLDSLRTAGIQHLNIDSLEHKRLDRYYPFAEQMFFWIGDANTGVFNGSPNGYYAEYEHAAELRGFHTPTVKYEVLASRYREDRFLPRATKEMSISKRDYSELAPLLLTGINSAEVEAFKKRNRDVVLTMDAKLQSQIQNGLAADTALQDNRVSVVIMDAGNGDVLASAAFPLPAINNWEQLTMTTAEQNRLGYWTTTSDLGFTYASQPGSTAKIATTLAAFNKMGEAAARRSFMVYPNERIRTKGLEPDETGSINLERALVNSNNVYFIKIANEEQLQEAMSDVYLQSGMFLKGVGGYYYEHNDDNKKQEGKWKEMWRKTEFATKPRYNPNNIRLTRAKGISGMAWGQGELIATPAAVARMVAGIANNGTLLQNRFVLKVSDQPAAAAVGTPIVSSPAYAALITDYMKKQSAGKVPILGISVAGKTGTPERVWKGERINDGWYVFFAPKATGAGNVVVCIRVESTRGSSDAVKVAGRHIIPLLLQGGYIKSFAPAQPAKSTGGSDSVIIKPKVKVSEPEMPVADTL